MQKQEGWTVSLIVLLLTLIGHLNQLYVGYSHSCIIHKITVVQVVLLDPEFMQCRIVKGWFLNDFSQV